MAAGAKLSNLLGLNDGLDAAPGLNYTRHTQLIGTSEWSKDCCKKNEQTDLSDAPIAKTSSDRDSVANNKPNQTSVRV